MLNIVCIQNKMYRRVIFKLAVSSTYDSAFSGFLKMYLVPTPMKMYVTYKFNK